MNPSHFRPKKTSLLERVRVDLIANAPDVRYTAMQQVAIMVKITQLVATAASRLSIVRIIWQYPLALLLLNTSYHSQRPMYLLHPASTLTISTRTTLESWAPVSHQIQHNKMELSSSNHWNAVTVDVNVSPGPALARRTAVDVVYDALAPKTPRVIRIWMRTEENQLEDVVQQVPQQRRYQPVMLEIHHW
jgi:hypothetical protein